MSPCAVVVIVMFQMAQPIDAFPDAPRVVPASVAGSHHLRFKNDDGYLERWMYSIQRDDGGWMQLSMVISNLGPSGGHAATDLMRLAPPLNGESEEHTFFRWPIGIEAGQWTARTDALDVRMGASWIRETSGGYEGAFRGWGYEFEFRIESIVPAWRPGDGRIHYPDEGHFSFHLMPAIGRLKGRERTHGGAWRPVSGQAWGEHTVTNRMPQDIATRVLRFRGTAGEYTIDFMELFTPARWDNARFGWIVVRKGSEIVYWSRDAHATPTRFQRDPTAPHHRMPVHFLVTAGALKLQVQWTERLYREDVLAPLPALLRSVISLFVQPINFFHRARFRLKLPDVERILGRDGFVVYSPLSASP